MCKNYTNNFEIKAELSNVSRPLNESVRITFGKLQAIVPQFPDPKLRQKIVSAFCHVQFE